MLVLKTNILVRPIVHHTMGNLLSASSTIKRSVSHRVNMGVVLAVSDAVIGVNIGDTVGYSTLDGTNVQHNGEVLVILSERETQAVVKSNHDIVKFGFHDRNEGENRHVSKSLEGRTCNYM